MSFKSCVLSRIRVLVILIVLNFLKDAYKVFQGVPPTYSPSYCLITNVLTGMALGLLCTGHHCSKPSKAQKMWTSLGRSGNSCSRLLSIDISRLATSESGTAIRYGWQQHYTIYLDKNTDFFVPQKDEAHWQIGQSLSRKETNAMQPFRKPR